MADQTVKSKESRANLKDIVMKKPRYATLKSQVNSSFRQLFFAQMQTFNNNPHT